jgi:hypothetical protein
LTLCTACGADAIKPRMGTLGGDLGLWCSACGAVDGPSMPPPSRGMHPHAARGADGGAPPILNHLSGQLLDVLAANVFRLSRPHGMPDSEFRETLRGMYH